MKALCLLVLFAMVGGNAFAEEGEKEISIENVSDGTYVTVYDKSKGGYLYGYSAWAYHDDPNRQNFNIKYYRNNNRDVIRFEYIPHGSCIRSYGDDIVDYDCDDFVGNDWEMLYTSTGAVQLKNMMNNKCLTNYAPGGSYANIGLRTCAGGPIPREQLWVVTAPRRDAK